MRRCDHSHSSDFRSTLRRLIALLAVALVASGLTWAAEFQLSTGNDSLTNNPIEDDLYTFSFSFSFMHKNLNFTAWENAFTDRSNDLRFDESYFSVSRSLGKMWGFSSEAEFGVVYVGEGLLGEGAQNTFHELVRSNPIELPYIEDSLVRPMGRLRLGRSYRVLPELALTPRMELYGAAGFRYHGMASVRALWQPIRWLSWSNEVGFRYDGTDFEPLEPWVRKSGWVLETTLSVKDRVSFSYNYNHYGVGFNHVRIDYHWNFKTGQRPRFIQRPPAMNQLPS